MEETVMENKLAHAAERKAFEIIVDTMIKQMGKNPSKSMTQIINMAEIYRKLLGSGSL